MADDGTAVSVSQACQESGYAGFTHPSPAELRRAASITCWTRSPSRSVGTPGAGSPENAGSHSSSMIASERMATAARRFGSSAPLRGMRVVNGNVDGDSSPTCVGPHRHLATQHTAVDDDPPVAAEQLELTFARAERHRRAADECGHTRLHTHDHHRGVVGVDCERLPVCVPAFGNRAPDVGAH